MGKQPYAMHTLAGEHPEIGRDDVSRLAGTLLQKLNKDSYSVACRCTYVPGRPGGLERNVVVEISGRPYITAGAMAGEIQFLSLRGEDDPPYGARALRPDEIVALSAENRFSVLGEEQARRIMEELLGPPTEG